jgi:sulfite exporter TauE/SafE
MLASISPLVERAPGTRWWRLTSSYLVGSVLGGATVGAVLGAVGDALRLRHSWVALAAVTAALAVLAALADLAGRVPSRRRQVDETWLSTYRDWVIGTGFGVQLGAGAVTIVTSASTYLTWWFEAATGSPAAGAVIGGCFGLARGLPLLTMAGVRDVTELRRRNAAIVTALPVARGIAIGAQLSIAGLVGVAAAVAAR